MLKVKVSNTAAHEHTNGVRGFLSAISQSRTLRLSQLEVDSVTVCCFLLIERALVHPLLFVLSVLTVIINPLLPERLNVQSVMDLSQVHLQQHNTGDTDTLMKE